MTESDDDYYRYVGEIFQGSVVENNRSYDHALEHYKKADRIGEKEECRILHYDSILFFGMGSVYKKTGKTELASKYLKESVKSAEYKAYREDAQELLNSL